MSRMGLPPIAGNGRYLAAMAVDTLGSGLFLPVSVLFFLRTTTLGVAEIGSGIALATVLSIPTGPAFGATVDRWGARNVVILSNVLRAVAFAAFAVVGSWGALVAASFVAQAGERAFYAAYAPLTTQVSTPATRRQWFGLLGVLRNVGFALGGLTAGLVMDGDLGYRALVMANAASFVVAAALLLGLHPPPLATAAAPERTAGGSWRTVLTDRPFLALSLLNICYALPSNALTLVLPLYLVHELVLPTWTVGLGFALNCALMAALQTPVVAWLARASHVRLLQGAAVLSAASAMLFWAAHLPGAAWAAVAVGVVVFTAGELLENPAMAALSSEAAPDHLRGRYLSVFQLSWSVANSVGIAAVTALMAVDFGLVWVALGMLSLAGGAGIAPIASRLAVRARRGEAGGHADDPPPERARHHDHVRPSDARRPAKRAEKQADG